VFAAFGPRVPAAEELARRLRNPAVGEIGMDQLRALDLVAELPRIGCPVLVSVGDADPVTPVPAAEEIVSGLRPGLGRLSVLEGAGHFPWLDAGERYRAQVARFVEQVATT
jgi:pimeloyl-ACP methyl ester carboxylesterase